MKISIIFALMLSVLMVGCGGSGSSLDPLYPPKVSSSAISSTPVSSTPVSSTSSSATVSSTSSSTPVEASSSVQSEISSSSESSSSESSVESSAESSSSETSSDASSSESSSSAASSSLGPIQTGVFLDAAVSNLGYRTQSLDGSTNELGEFNYREGETIVFFIGELEFPAVPVADIITPLDLANTDNPNNPVVINIARLLQSLDSDGDAENGISLSEAAISAARILDFTLAPEIFEQLPAVQSWLQESGGPNQSLVSTEQALAHLQATLDFIYGPGSSSSSSAIANSASSSSSVVESSSSAESSQVQSSNSSVTGGEQSSSSSQETSSSEASSEASSEIAVSSESSVTSSETSTSSVESSVASSEASSAASSEESSSSAESSVASSEVSSSVESSAISSEDSSSSVESSVASSEASSSAESSSSSEDDVWQGNAYDLFGTSTSIPQGVINLNTDNAITMTAKGGSINTSNRKFFFAHQPVSGDFVFSARLASVAVANEGAFTVLANNQFRYGLLAVENLNAVASYPELGRFAEIGLYTATAAPTFTGSRAYKLDVGGSTTQSRTNGTWTVGNYLRIARTGNSIHLSTSVDGEAYTAVNTSSLADANSNPIGSDWHIGFYAASGADELTLVFDNISLETGSTASSSSSDSSAQSSNSSEVASSSSIASSVESSSSSVESSSSSSVVIIGSSSSAGSETSSSAESSVASSEESSSAESSAVSSEVSSSAESSVASSEESSSAESSAVSSEASSSVESSVASSEESSSAESSVVSSEASSSAESSVASSAESSSSESSASSSEESSSSEASSSSSSAGIVNTLLPIYEDFDNVVDATSFTTNYKLLATDNQISFYHRLSGAFALAGDVNQALVLSPVRLSLGNTTPAVETTSSDSATTGELDLSEPYRISFCVLDRNSAGNLQVQIDNNTTGGGNSIHSGSTSRIYSQSISGLTVGQRVTINSSLGTPTSFVTLRVDGGGSVTIDDLWIGYQSDTSTEPAAETCIPPAPVAPAAPQVTAGDAELSVTWSAIAGATGYELVYNTIDTIDGATEYANNPVTGTSTTITGLTNDTTYYVFVRAVNTGGSSAYSASTSGIPVAAGGEEEPEEPAGSWIGNTMDLFGTSGTVPTGSISNSSATGVTITVGGGNVNSSNRRYYFAYQTVTGNFVFTARLAGVTATSGSFTTTSNNAYRFGLLISENISVASSYVNSARFAEAGFYTTAATPVFRGSRGYKTDTGTGSPNFTRSDIGAAGDLGIGTYMRISRTGTSVSISYSTDGVDYTVANTSSFAETNSPIPDTWYVGLFGAPQQELTLVFDNISIVQN